MKESKYIYMGKCVKPHGVKGAFHFQLINVQESVLDKGSVLWLYPLAPESQIEKEGVAYKIERISFGHKVMAFLEGVEGRNQAETLIPFEIYQDREDFPELEEGEYYLEDLKGFKVYEHKSGELLGSVKSFYDNGAQEVMMVRPSSGPFLEIPFVEAFIHEVLLDEKKITVTKLEYFDGKK